MACEDGIGGGKIIKGRPMAKGWGGIEGLKVWRNLYGSEFCSAEVGGLGAIPAGFARAARSE